MQTHQPTAPFGRRLVTFAHVAQVVSSRRPPDKCVHEWTVLRAICLARRRQLASPALPRVAFAVVVQFAFGFDLLRFVARADEFEALAAESEVEARSIEGACEPAAEPFDWSAIHGISRGILERICARGPLSVDREISDDGAGTESATFATRIATSPTTGNSRDVLVCHVRRPWRIGSAASGRAGYESTNHTPRRGISAKIAGCPCRYALSCSRRPAPTSRCPRTHQGGRCENPTDSLTAARRRSIFPNP